MTNSNKLEALEILGDTRKHRDYFLHMQGPLTVYKHTADIF